MARRRIRGVELAKAIHRSQAYVSRRLNGETAFDLDDLELIAEALGVKVADLLPAGGVTRQFRKSITGTGERVVAVGGADRQRRTVHKGATSPVRAHRPGRPVTQTRPLSRSSL